MTELRWFYVDDDGKPLPLETRSGLAAFEIVVAGKAYRIQPEQKHLRYGVVFVNPRFPDTVTLPQDREPGARKLTIPGATADPRIVYLVKLGLDALDCGSFRPGIFKAEDIWRGKVRPGN